MTRPDEDGATAPEPLRGRGRRREFVPSRTTRRHRWLQHLALIPIMPTQPSTPTRVHLPSHGCKSHGRNGPPRPRVRGSISCSAQEAPSGCRYRLSRPISLGPELSSLPPRARSTLSGMGSSNRRTRWPSFIRWYASFLSGSADLRTRSSRTEYWSLVALSDIRRPAERRERVNRDSATFEQLDWNPTITAHCNRRGARGPNGCS